MSDIERAQNAAESLISINPGDILVAADRIRSITHANSDRQAASDLVSKHEDEEHELDDAPAVSVDDVDERLSGLISQVGSLENQLKNMSSGTDREFRSLRDKIGLLETRMVRMNARIDELETTNEKLSSQQTALQEILEERVASMVAQSESVHVLPPSRRSATDDSDAGFSTLDDLDGTFSPTVKLPRGQLNFTSEPTETLTKTVERTAESRLMRPKTKAAETPATSTLDRATKAGIDFDF